MSPGFSLYSTTAPLDEASISVDIATVHKFSKSGIGKRNSNHNHSKGIHPTSKINNGCDTSATSSPRCPICKKHHIPRQDEFCPIAVQQYTLRQYLDKHFTQKEHTRWERLYSENPDDFKVRYTNGLNHGKALRKAVRHLHTTHSSDPDLDDIIHLKILKAICDDPDLFFASQDYLLIDYMEPEVHPPPGLFSSSPK